MKIALPDAHGHLSHYSLTGTPLPEGRLSANAVRTVYSAAHAFTRFYKPLLDARSASASAWTVAQMAELAAISPSRLHEWFRAELDTSPRAWLAARLFMALKLNG